MEVGALMNNAALMRWVMMGTETQASSGHMLHVCELPLSGNSPRIPRYQHREEVWTVFLCYFIFEVKAAEAQKLPGQTTMF